jgi:hypothetical protein
VTPKDFGVARTNCRSFLRDYTLQMFWRLPTIIATRTFFILRDDGRRDLFRLLVGELS